MQNEPKGDGAGAGISAAMVEDVFLTDAFLIKGRLQGKYQRLARMLEDGDRQFLTVEDAVMVSLRSNDVVRTPRVQVNVREIILAHELVDMAGDTAYRNMAADDKNVRIRAFYSGHIQVEFAGRISPRGYEPARGQGRRFFVMQEPVIRGLDLESSDELKLLRSLPYAIIQKDRLSYLYDFS
jgi:hypothetical protein